MPKVNGHSANNQGNAITLVTERLEPVLNSPVKIGSVMIKDAYTP
jgi:hypothetical protein